MVLYGIKGVLRLFMIWLDIVLMYRLYGFMRLDSSLLGEVLYLWPLRPFWDYV